MGVRDGQGQNSENLAWVSSITKIVSENTMQAAVWSEKRGFRSAPIAS